MWNTVNARLCCAMKPTHVKELLCVKFYTFLLQYSYNIKDKSKFCRAIKYILLFNFIQHD